MNLRSVTFVRIAPFISFRNHHPQDSMWPMIMGYSGAIALEKGLQTHILDTWAEPCSLETLLEKVRKIDPDMVIVEADSPVVDFARQFASRIKADMKRPLWACGQHASILPQSFYQKTNSSLLFDGCLLGEYDAVMKPFLDSYRGKKPLPQIPGILPFKGEAGPKESGGLDTPAMLCDLDSHPRIPYSLLPLARYHIFSSQVPVFHHLQWGFCLTSRGCPYKCIYCSPTLRQSFGHEYRQQSADRVVEDMEDQKSRIKVNAIFMEDDVFSLDRNKTLEICEKLQRRRPVVPFIIQTRFDALDKDRITSLKAAGCVGITAGVESGTNRILNIMKKGTSREKILESAREIKKQRIPLTAYFMVGCPEETQEEMEATLRLAKEVDALMIQVAFFTPYPGSPIHNQLTQSSEKEGQDKNLSHYNIVAVNLSAMDDETLHNFQNHFYRTYYFSFRFLLSYMRNRFFYAAFNNHELRLLWNTFRFLFKKESASNTHCRSKTNGLAKERNK